MENHTAGQPFIYRVSNPSFHSCHFYSYQKVLLHSRATIARTIRYTILFALLLSYGIIPVTSQLQLQLQPSSDISRAVTQPTPSSSSLLSSPSTTTTTTTTTTISSQPSSSSTAATNTVSIAAADNAADTNALNQSQGKLGSMIEPSNCAARGYTWEKFYFLGCFVAARTTATTGAVSESNDAKCKADDSASAKTTTANDYWRVCNTTAPVIYQAVDPNTRQLTNCDVSTELPSNAGTIHGCYRMSDNNGGSSDVSSFAGLQCMSNGRLLNCTGTWQRLFTLTSGAGLPATSSNGNGMIQNDNESANDGASSKMSPAAWAGIIGGVAVGGVGIVGMAILFTRRYILKRRAQQDQMRRLTEFGS